MKAAGFKYEFQGNSTDKSLEDDVDELLQFVKDNARGIFDELFQFRSILSDVQYSIDLLCAGIVTKRRKKKIRK